MNEQKNQDTIRKLLPPWRKAALTAHAQLSKIVVWVISPFTWVLEQVNGTADFKAAEERYDAAVRRARTQAA